SASRGLTGSSLSLVVVPPAHERLGPPRGNHLNASRRPRWFTRWPYPRDPCLGDRHRLLCRGALDVLQQRSGVEAQPVFRDQAVLYAVDDDPGERELLVGGPEAHEVAGVALPGVEAHRHLAPRGDDVVDQQLVASERRLEGHHVLDQRLVAGKLADE